jgi:hypothetical protein
VNVHVNKGNVGTEVRRIDAENVMKSFIDLVEDFLLEWGLLAGACISLVTLGLSIRRNPGSKSYHFGSSPHESKEK